MAQSLMIVMGDSAMAVRLGMNVLPQSSVVPDPHLRAAARHQGDINLVKSARIAVRVGCNIRSQSMTKTSMGLGWISGRANNADARTI